MASLTCYDSLRVLGKTRFLPVPRMGNHVHKLFSRGPIRTTNPAAKITVTRHIRWLDLLVKWSPCGRNFWKLGGDFQLVRNCPYLSPAIMSAEFRFGNVYLEHMEALYQIVSQLGRKIGDYGNGDNNEVCLLSSYNWILCQREQKLSFNLMNFR